MTIQKIPGCPSCKGEVTVTEYRCPKCDITVKGQFRAGPLTALNDEQVTFVAAFLASHGSIKEMEARLGISYPTVKTRLKEINRTLGLEEALVDEKTSGILESLEAGEIDVAEALNKLEKEA